MSTWLGKRSKHERCLNWGQADGLVELRSRWASALGPWIQTGVRLSEERWLAPKFSSATSVFLLMKKTFFTHILPLSESPLAVVEDKAQEGSLCLQSSQGGHVTLPAEWKNSLFHHNCSKILKQG